MRNNILSFLSLCRKALKLKMGFDSVEKTLKDAKVILFSCDVSEKTKERMKKKAEGFKIPCREMPFTQEEIYITIGKNISVMSITDEGLARAFLDRLDKEEPSDGLQ